MYRLTVFYFSIFVLFLSCRSIEKEELQSALIQAKNNRQELESVLEYFDHGQDKRKLAAAEFLIRNMQYHYTQTSKEWDAYFICLDSISRLTPTRWNVSNEQDSLLRCLRFPSTVPPKIYDTEVVRSTDLIHHIEFAFALYDSAEWCRNISFNDFCEYLLPYRIADERVDLNWVEYYHEAVEDRAFKAFQYGKTLKDSLYIILDRMSSNYKIDIEYKNRYPFGYLPQQMLSLKRGTCANYNILSCFLFRSVGIPISIDFTPVWGNRSLGHSWNALFINPAIVDTTSALDYSFSAAKKPLGQYLSCNPNRPTKVYRYTFSRQAMSLGAIHGDEEIPKELESVFIKDVSDEYGLSNDISVDVPKSLRTQKYYYLCSFDNQRWRPIAWTQLENGKITFTNVGGGIIYLPCYYINGKMIEVAAPILVNIDGTIQEIKTDLTEEQSMTLYRKYSSGENIQRYSHLFGGARIEVSDNVAFQNSKIVHVFEDSISVNYQYLRFPQPIHGRYVRFISSNGKFGGEVADIQAFDANKNKLIGRVIGSNNWEDKHPLSAAFDDNVLSYAMSTDSDGAWLGVDFGKKSYISEIHILPHNDDNFIRVGDHYQLQYWYQGTWNIIGDQIGDERQYLHFDLCPSHGLYRLRNLTRGKEERIFTYENGKQVWW